MPITFIFPPYSSCKYFLTFVDISDTNVELGSVLFRVICEYHKFVFEMRTHQCQQIVCWLACRYATQFVDTSDIMINIELDSNVLVKFICQSIINAWLKGEYTNMSQPSLADYLLVSWDIKCKVNPQLKRQSFKPDILNTLG